MGFLALVSRRHIATLHLGLHRLNELNLGLRLDLARSMRFLRGVLRVNPTALLLLNDAMAEDDL